MGMKSSLTIHKIVLHMQSPFAGTEGIGDEGNMLDPMPDAVAFIRSGNTVSFALVETIQKQINDLIYVEHHYTENPTVQPTHDLRQCSYNRQTFESRYRIESIKV